MSRSGYSDDCENLELWRGAVRSALRGKRGQAALREIANALDSLPEKRLAAGSLVTAEGEFCTLGALGRSRGVDLSKIDPDDSHQVAEAFGISNAMACEIMFLNDEHCDDWKFVTVEVCGPVRPWQGHTRNIRVADDHAAEKRWSYMREWVQKNLHQPA